jgi:phosphotriesterase-related protein
MIETALGPIPPEQLGITSMNENMLSDSSTLLRPSREPMPAIEKVTLENLGFLRWNYLAMRDNLVLDEPDVAVKELAFAHGLGQRTVVSITSWGMGPRHSDLPAISRESGMNIAVAYGTYLSRSLPDWLLSMDENQLEAHLHFALTEAIPGTDYRAALLGLVGTGPELDAVEHRSLVASARAAARAGASVSIRLDPAARRGPEILALVTAEGLPAENVIFANVDEFMELDYLLELGDSGATLEMDFGNEAYYHDKYKDATDADRVAFLLELFEQPRELSITFGNSVWTKGQLRTYGGMGYGHMLSRIVPMLLRAGVSQERLDEILIHRPRFLLDHSSLAH